MKRFPLLALVLFVGCAAPARRTTSVDAPVTTTVTMGLPARSEVTPPALRSFCVQACLNSDPGCLARCEGGEERLEKKRREELQRLTGLNVPIEFADILEEQGSAGR